MILILLQALTCTNQTVAFWLNWGRLLADSARESAATRSFRQRTAILPAKRLEQALAALTRAIELASTDPDQTELRTRALRERARVHRQLGQDAAADFDTQEAR